jgi:hypothetical protein
MMLNKPQQQQIEVSIKKIKLTESIRNIRINEFVGIV